MLLCVIGFRYMHYLSVYLRNKGIGHKIFFYLMGQAVFGRLLSMESVESNVSRCDSLNQNDFLKLVNVLKLKQESLHKLKILELILRLLHLQSQRWRRIKLECFRK
jgi:hypothetical protein